MCHVFFQITTQNQKTQFDNIEHYGYIVYPQYDHEASLSKNNWLMCVRCGGGGGEVTWRK